MTEVKLIYGPKTYFEQILKDDSVEFGEETKRFTEIMIDADKISIRIPQKEDAEKVLDNYLYKFKTLVVESGEYASVKEHVLLNIYNIFTRYEFDNIYIHNPPEVFKYNIQRVYGISEENIKVFEYKDLTESLIKGMDEEFSENIVGQEEAKDHILSSLIPLTRKDNTEPVVLLFFGPSGVGKTESAKFISQFLGGENTKLFRRQFSMFQNEHFASYLFGSSNNEQSFAKDLLERETNVILLDEFDKVNPVFHNAFYQMFDEGIFEDSNYSVNLKKSIIICTSNYDSKEKVQEILGDPIYSRFDACIEFRKLDSESTKLIIDKIFSEEFDKLNEKDKSSIPVEELKTQLINTSSSLHNVRNIRSTIREVFSRFVLNRIVNN